VLKLFGRADAGEVSPAYGARGCHRLDGKEKLPEAAQRAWPGYRVECGACRDGGSAVMPVSIFIFFIDAARH
jgi:hypothetical protein